MQISALGCQGYIQRQWKLYPCPQGIYNWAWVKHGLWQIWLDFHSIMCILLRGPPRCYWSGKLRRLPWRGGMRSLKRRLFRERWALQAQSFATEVTWKKGKDESKTKQNKTIIGICKETFICNSVPTTPGEATPSLLSQGRGPLPHSLHGIVLV